MLGEAVVPFCILGSILNGAPQERIHPLEDNRAEPSLSDMKLGKLSAREAEVLRCLREGAPNKVIARQLDVAEATVKVHIKMILRKIGVSNRTQAALWASRHLPRRSGALVNG
ncbi:hypothetical protein DC522_29550 [Microvirga sp. KLBC 81]|nr:hypothetical protein DC522_29550 [Microvirga sp. KLBC 81]